MLSNAYLNYFLAKIRFDTAENEQHLPKFCQPTLSDVAAAALALAALLALAVAVLRLRPLHAQHQVVVPRVKGAVGALSKNAFSKNAFSSEIPFAIVGSRGRPAGAAPWKGRADGRGGAAGAPRPAEDSGGLGRIAPMFFF